MNFEYVNKADQLYQVENYKFRFNARNVAEIELLILFNNGVEEDFGYQVAIDDENVPKEFRNFSSTKIDVKQHVKADLTGIFKTKEDALQDAIDVISKLMDYYTGNKI